MGSRGPEDRVAVVQKERNHCLECKRHARSRTKSAACQVDAPDISYTPLRSRSGGGDCLRQQASYSRRRNSIPRGRSNQPARPSVAASLHVAAGHENRSCFTCRNICSCIFFMVTCFTLAVLLWPLATPMNWPRSSQHQLKQMSRIISALSAREGVLTRRYLALHKVVHALQRKIDDVAALSSMQDDIRKVVSEQLALYDADKLGLADYALESAGGTVIETPDTVTYYPDSWFEVFGFPLFRYGPCYGPGCMLQPSVHPGNCWAFRGTHGSAKIRLARRIHIVGVTVEHIPSSIALSGDVSSAPKKFLVSALVPASGKQLSAHTLGVYEYKLTGPSLQSFRVQNAGFSGTTNLVQLSVLENHGNPEYTCLYRIRVHGHEELSANTLL